MLMLHGTRLPTTHIVTYHASILTSYLHVTHPYLTTILSETPSYFLRLWGPEPVRMPDPRGTQQSNIQEFQKLTRTARLASSRLGFARC